MYVCANCVYMTKYRCCSGMTRFLPDRQQYVTPPGTSCQPRLTSIPDNQKSSEFTTFQGSVNHTIFFRHFNFVSV